MQTPHSKSSVLGTIARRSKRTNSEYTSVKLYSLFSFFGEAEVANTSEEEFLFDSEIIES